MPASDLYRLSRRLESLYHPMYTRRTFNRQRVFVPKFVQAVSPALSGTGTLTATAVVTQQAVVAFSGVGSLDVFPVVIPKYTALSYIPADTSLIVAGHDLGDQAECQLGNGANVPSGTTGYGFVDTTYTVSKTQILATYSTSVL